MEYDLQSKAHQVQVTHYSMATLFPTLVSRTPTWARTEATLGFKPQVAYLNRTPSFNPHSSPGAYLPSEPRSVKGKAKEGRTGDLPTSGSLTEHPAHFPHDGVC